MSKHAHLVEEEEEEEEEEEDEEDEGEPDEPNMTSLFKSGLEKNAGNSSEPQEAMRTTTLTTTEQYGIQTTSSVWGFPSDSSDLLDDEGTVNFVRIQRTTAPEIKERLRRFGLPVTGLKKELAYRLFDALREKYYEYEEDDDEDDQPKSKDWWS